MRPPFESPDVYLSLLSVPPVQILSFNLYVFASLRAIFLLQGAPDLRLAAPPD
jgi:hypothetical protein